MNIRNIETGQCIKQIEIIKEIPVMVLMLKICLGKISIDQSRYFIMQKAELSLSRLNVQCRLLDY